MIRNFKHLIIVIFVITTSCVWFNQLKSDDKIAKSLDNIFKSSSDKIDLSDYGDFEWDNLIIFGPYSQIEKTENELRIDLSNIRENGIKYDDRINLIVFIKENKSIKIAEISREIGDFEPENKLIKKEKAIFKKIGRINVIVD